MNNVRSIENLTEAELKHNIFGGVSKGSWHEKYKNSAWVFLGGLPFELTEGDVICVMSQWGEIEDIHLVREKDTGKSRGFAFIKYEDARSTILAVDNMNGAKLLGQTLRCDHVDQYRLPKEVQEREAEQWEEQGGGSIDIGPGHAYKGKELANDFDISHGVNLWSSSSANLPKKPTAQANYFKEENMANNESKEAVDHLRNDQHSQLLPSSSPSQPDPQQARYGDEPSENYSREGYGSKRYHSSDDDSRSRSRSRDRKRDKKSKKEKKHKKHKRRHRDSRSRSPSCNDERHRDRKDRYDDEDDERRRRRDKEHRRSRSRERHRRDRDDDSRDGRSHRNRRSTRSSSRSPHRRDARNDSDDNRSTDSRSRRRQRDEAKKRADKKELEKAMLAAAMTATEILGPSTTSGASTAINNNSSSASGNNGNGLILAGGGPVASWRGRRDPEIRAKLAAAEKKLANAASFGTTGFKGNRDDVAGIGGAKRIR